MIGAGPVGLELGQAFSHLGSEVIIVDIRDKLLPMTEPEVGNSLLSILKEEGIRLLLGYKVVNVKKEGGRVKVHLKENRGLKREDLEVDSVFLAAGRVPNTGKLGLESLDVTVNGHGFIKTNEFMETNVKGVYAAGDVVDKKYMLETLAAKEGAVAGFNMVRGNEIRMSYDAVLVAVFTTPQVAFVGFKEEEYLSKEGVCSCRTIRLEDLAKARILSEKGVVKMVVDPRDKRIVGVHVLALNAAEIVMEGSLTIRYGLTIDDIIDMPHVFPTISESIKLASQAFLRSPKRMSCCVE